MPDPFDFYLSSPAVWKGAVYFGSGDGNMYALDAVQRRAEVEIQDGRCGACFAGDCGWQAVSWGVGIAYFYALDAATGAEVWRFKTGEDPEIHNQVGIQSSATVANGVVYFGCRDSKFYALDAATGKQRCGCFRIKARG